LDNDDFPEFNILSVPLSLDWPHGRKRKNESTHGGLKTKTPTPIDAATASTIAKSDQQALSQTGELSRGTTQSVAKSPEVERANATTFRQAETTRCGREKQKKLKADSCVASRTFSMG
jgi:hypothetical protein